MSIEHTVIITSTPDGYLPSCSCGWRNVQFTGYGEAQEKGDKHEQDAKALRLNSGARPSLRTTAGLFRANANNPVYTDDERTMWRLLAEEAEDELAKRARGPLEGQMELF